MSDEPSGHAADIPNEKPLPANSLQHCTFDEECNLHTINSMASPISSLQSDSMNTDINLNMQQDTVNYLTGYSQSEHVYKNVQKGLKPLTYSLSEQKQNINDTSKSIQKSVKSNKSQLSTGTTASGFCRICHEGESKEELIAPCKCAGTMGQLHRTCVETWLSASNSDSCEICKFHYVTERKPKPFIEWLRKPSKLADRKNLIGDFMCFLFLSPLAAVSLWLCITGAIDYLLNSSNSMWEASGLVMLSCFLGVIYITWVVVAVRYHIRMFHEWQKTHQYVRFLGCVDDQGKFHEAQTLFFRLYSPIGGNDFAVKEENEMQLSISKEKLQPSEKTVD